MDYTYVGGSQATGSQVVHNVTPEEVTQGYVVVEAKNGTSYPSCITVDLAYMPPIKTVYWDWKNNYPSGIRTVNFEKTTVDYVASNDPNVSLIFVTGKLSNNGNESYDYSQFTENSVVRVPVASTSDVLTVTYHPSGFNTNSKYKIGGTSQSSNPAVYNVTAADVSNGYVEIISGGSYIYSITLDKGNPYTTEAVGPTGWATYSYTSATSFADLAGVVDAYKVTGFTGTAINKVAVTTAAANKGLLLNAAAGTYAIPLVSSGDALDGNQLVAQTSAGTVTAAGTGYRNYVLVAPGGTVAFKSITGDNSASIGAGKAYLHLDISGGEPGANFLYFNDETTGVNKVKDQVKEARGDFFDLQGRKVAQPTKGLYIVNGKKVVIK